MNLSYGKEFQRLRLDQSFLKRKELVISIRKYLALKKGLVDLVETVFVQSRLRHRNLNLIEPNLAYLHFI